MIATLIDVVKLMIFNSIRCLKLTLTFMVFACEYIWSQCGHSYDLLCTKHQFVCVATLPWKNANFSSRSRKRNILCDSFREFFNSKLQLSGTIWEKNSIMKNFCPLRISAMFPYCLRWHHKNFEPGWGRNFDFDDASQSIFRRNCIW